MIKKSILKKIFFMNLIILISTVFIALLLNNKFLKTYHINQKKKILYELADMISKTDLTRDDTEKLEETYGVLINKLPKHDMMDRRRPNEMDNRPDERNMMNRSNFRNNDKFRDNNMNNRENDNDSPDKRRGMFFKELDQVEALDIQNGGKIFKIIKHPIFGMDFLSIFFKSYRNEIIYVGFSLNMVNEAVKISNKFYIFVSLISLIIGSILSFVFGKNITKPLIEINNVTKKMSDMDFSEKCFINTGDEIEELSKNINSLSHNLEKNMQGLKLANEKLKEEIEREKKIDELRKEFIGSVSHEIKTPVALINTYTESLKENIVDESDKDFYYDVIMEEGNNISKLLNELLELLENEEKDLKLNIEKFNLNEVLELEVYKFKPNYIEKNIKVEINIDEDIEILAEKEKMKKVFGNLIRNAVSYVNENGEIKINGFFNKNKFIVEVFNSGSKIPEESLDKIWNPFYKVDKARTRKYGGTGLGLSIVKNILNKHNFNYGVNNMDNGVKFWVEMDIKKA